MPLIVGSGSSGKTRHTQTFTASGSFTVPANVYSLWATVVSGGGGGGGMGGGLGSLGGGGGASEAKRVKLAVTPADVLTLTVGAGGAGGPGGTFGTGGSNGGTSKVAKGSVTLASADPGSGGSGGQNTNTTPGAGGAGGGFNQTSTAASTAGASTTDFLTFGDNEWIANGPSGGSIGAGGASRLFKQSNGTSGASGQLPGPAAIASSGIIASTPAGYGAGGEGGNVSFGTGGSGQPGVIILEWEE